MYRFPFNGTYPLTQAFDANPDFYRPYGLPAHEGVDWGMPVGTPLVSISAAKIKEVVSDPLLSAYGRHLRTAWTDAAGQKWETIYAHLDKISVIPGQEVKIGELIGHSGNTGRSTGPHLHFSLKKLGTRTASKHGGAFMDLVDPLPLLSLEAPQNSEAAPDKPTLPPAPPSPNEPEGVVYRVTSEVGLKLRQHPTVRAKILVYLQKGDQVRALPSLGQEAEGYLWRQAASPQRIQGVEVGGAWFAERQVYLSFAEVLRSG
jgi:hypothetical protein